MANSDDRPDWGALIEGLPETEPELLLAIERLLEERRYERAEELLDSALRRLPTPGLLKTQGRLQIECERYERGCSLLEPLCEGDDVDPEALVLYARGKAHTGAINEAEARLDEALTAGADRAEIRAVQESLNELRPDFSETELDAVDHDDETLNVGDAWRRAVRATAGSSEHGPGNRSNWLTTDTFEPRDPGDDPSESDLTAPETVQATEDILGNRDIVEPDDATVSDAAGAETIRTDTAPEPEDAPPPDAPDPDTAEQQQDDLFSVSTSRPTTDIEEILLETVADEDSDSGSSETAETKTDGIRTTRWGMGRDEVEEADDDSKTVDLKVRPVSTSEREHPLKGSLGGGDSDVTAEARPSVLARSDSEGATSSEGPSAGFDRDDVTNPEVPRPKTADRNVNEDGAEERGSTENPPDGPRGARGTPNPDGGPNPSGGSAGRPAPEQEPGPGESPRSAEGRDESTEDAGEVDAQAPTENVDRPYVGGGESSGSLSVPDGSWEPGHVLEERREGAPNETRSDRESEPPPSSEEQELPSEPYGTRGSSGLRSLVAVLAGMGAVFAVVFSVAGVVTHFDRRAVSKRVDRIRTASKPDTYRGWREAFEIASNGADAAPSRLRAMLHRLGSMILPNEPEGTRRQLLRERAVVAAMLEYRFETCGSREASRHIRRAFRNRAPHRARAVAQTYRHLACGETYRAARAARQAEHRFGTSPRLAAARLSALLETHDTGGIIRQRKRLRSERDEPTIYEAYLLGRAEATVDRSDALETLRSLVEERAPEHLDTSIAIVRLLAATGEPDRALERGRSLLENRLSDASILQRVRLHNAVARAHAGKEDLEGARSLFESATELGSGRDEAHLPAIDLALSNDEIDRARSLVEEAISAVGMTDRLAERRARIFARRGRWRRALDSLPTPEHPELGDALLAARLHLKTGSFEAARDAAKAVSERDSRYPVAESLRLLAVAHLHDLQKRERRNRLVRKMSNVQSNHPDDPKILGAAARLRIRLAQFSVDRERIAHLQKALDYARNANELAPDRASTPLLLCEIQLEAHEPEGLEEACRSAREQNPQSVAPYRASIRAALAAGRLEEASSLLDRMPETGPDRWRDVALRIRFALERLDLQKAEALLEEWRSRAERRPSYRLLSGHAAFERGDYGRAVQRYGGVSGHGPIAWEARLYRAHSYTRMGRYEAALELIDRLNDTVRWRAASWLIFGELRRSQGRMRDALENLRLAKRFYRDGFRSPRRHAELEAQLARVWGEFRGWTDTRVGKHLGRARDVAPERRPEVRLVLGLYFWRTDEQDLERAAEEFRRVLEVQTRRCEAVSYLSDVYRQLEASEKLEALDSRLKEYCDR